MYQDLPPDAIRMARRFARQAGIPTGMGPGLGRGGPGRRMGGPLREPPAVSTEEVRGWLSGRLPDGWFTQPVEVTVDRDEITVVGSLAAPAAAPGSGPDEVAAAEAGRIARFREETRPERMKISDEAQQRFGRSVAWGAVSGGTRVLFTTASVPVMTRLRQPARIVLDTLVDSGVARSRSEALAWCVRLVGDHAEGWLSELRSVLTEVERVRTRGPGLDSDDAEGPRADPD